MKSTGQLSEEKGKRNNLQAEIQLLTMQKNLSFEENNIFSEIFNVLKFLRHTHSTDHESNRLMRSKFSKRIFLA